VKTLVRPWPVLKAQLRLFARGLWAPSIIRMGRTVTYMDDMMIGPFVIRRHYVQIGTESGEILYVSPHMSLCERREFIAAIERKRAFYINAKEAS